MTQRKVFSQIKIKKLKLKMFKKYFYVILFEIQVYMK